MKLTRRTALAAAGAAVALPRAARAQTQTVLRVAMTLGDIQSTTGQPSQGGEGQRFIGFTLYDGLLNWDLSRSDVPSPLTPGLALSWEVDEATHTVWTFKLRPDVRFHDGSAFDADAVVWNLDKLMNRKAPQYDQAQATQAGTYFASIASYRAVDSVTLEIITKAPDAVFPYQCANIYMSSPARWKELGRDWNDFAAQLSGTCPWVLEKLVPRHRAELRRNAAYWDPKRVPKSDRMILRAIPDASTRIAALMSGQVDWAPACRW
jgi:peptide/nickel transport system substrate-binding protein